VLTDLKMAPLDGLAVLRGALRSRLPPVIVMTGYGTVESAVAAMQQGPRLLSKPSRRRSCWCECSGR